MPEYAEVKIIVSQLERTFGGSPLTGVTVEGGKFLKAGIAGLEGLQLPLQNIHFHSHGKFIYWIFDSDRVAFNHLGMAAGFGSRSKHSAIKFSFGDREVFFNDIRHFGNFQFSDKEGLKTKLKTLGWNLLEPIPANFILELRTQNHKAICTVMLDQRYFSGCGNYLRSEALYRARIHPLTPISKLSNIQLETLCMILQRTVQEALDQGGATIATFKDLDGKSGKFFDKFQIYSRRLDPLGNKVIKETGPEGRSIFYVSELQQPN